MIENESIMTQADPSDVMSTPYRPQYELVAERIAQFITQSALKPGERLPTELQLAKRFGVSRNIVRDAIKVLTSTGLIGVRKGVGIYMSGGPRPIARKTIDLSMPIDPQHIESLLAFRCIQEMVTTRLATEQITMAELRELDQAVSKNLQSARAGDWDHFLATDIVFHHGIARATHNPFLVETIASVLELQRWTVRTVTGGLPGSMLVAAQQHAAIFVALREGKSEEAAQAMKVHIDTVIDDYHHAIKRWLMGDHDAASDEGTLTPPEG